MSFIRKIIKVSLVFSFSLLFIPTIKEITIKEKVDNIINLKKEEKNEKVNNIYEGYIYFPKFDYKNLIKVGSDALDENLVEMLEFSDKIGESNIILAGHNNRYVFNKIYYLDINDQIIISDFNTDYRYIVKETKYIKVDDYSIFNNKDSLTLITCSSDNQQRYIVIAKRE